MKIKVANSQLFNLMGEVDEVYDEVSQETFSIYFETAKGEIAMNRNQIEKVVLSNEYETFTLNEADEVVVEGDTLLLETDEEDPYPVGQFHFYGPRPQLTLI